MLRSWYMSVNFSNNFRLNSSYILSGAIAKSFKFFSLINSIFSSSNFLIILFLLSSSSTPSSFQLSFNAVILLYSLLSTLMLNSYIAYILVSNDLIKWCCYCQSDDYSGGEPVAEGYGYGTYDDGVIDAGCLDAVGFVCLYTLCEDAEVSVAEECDDILLIDYCIFLVSFNTCFCISIAVS